MMNTLFGGGNEYAKDNKSNGGIIQINKNNYFCAKINWTYAKFDAKRIAEH